MTDHGQAYDYPASVAFQVRDDAIEDYVRAADFLNAGRFDIACLQHEFGIFGGEAGANILELLSRLTMPIVTTLHTVLAKPTAVQRAVMERIVEGSSKIIVMANKGRELLRSVYRVPDEKIEVIAHGIPDFPFVEPDVAKAKLGFSGRCRHSDIRPAISQQGHRGHDRRHALDPETNAPTRSTSCSVPPIPIWFGIRAKPIARA